MSELSIILLGAGTIGASWAALFLSYKTKVMIYDPSREALTKVKPNIEHAWQSLNTLDPTLKDIPWSKLTLHQNLASITSVPDWVQENAPDRLELKQSLLQQAELYFPPDVPIASSTTALMATDIQAAMTFPERFIIAHPFNPPHLIPLVEVVAGKKTSPYLTEKAKIFYEGFGKEVVIPKREAIGHIANRLNAALYREVVNMVAKGIASVEDIDRSIVHGPGLRWAFIGPNLVYHLAGGDGGYSQYLDHLGPSQEKRWENLDEVSLTAEVKEKLVEGLQEAVRDSSVEILREKRDAALIGLLSLKRRLAEDSH